MNNNIYKNYKEVISNSLSNGTRRGALNKSHGLSGLSDILNSVETPQIRAQNDEVLFESLKLFSTISGKKSQAHLVPGSHPDFKHITSMVSENHYITSMFIDIKRSTALFKKYEPPVVANITSTIQKAAIHTAWYFDGYIQRFHGDGLMIYFGGKNIPLQTSVDNALTAASFFSYFMENDLKNVFLEQGVEKIFTRIGIDVGYDEDVYWYKAGMGDCGEITTCSLHTSLAAHMQGCAYNNGIMVGDNVKKNTTISQDSFKIKSETERYIFTIPEESFYYTQWDFNWIKYLKNHPSIKVDENGDLSFVGTTSNSLTAAIRNEKNVDYLRGQTQGYKPYYG